jgi:ComF family protein
LNNIWLKFNQSIFPQTCIMCAAWQGGAYGICDGCLADMPWHNCAQCPQCGLPAYDNQLCGHCINSPPDFDATRALFRYAFPIQQMLQRYKYGELLALGASFGHLLANHMAANLLAEMPDLIIPMPLHPKRLQERGFNQSLEVARIVSEKLNVKLDHSVCERIKLSPPQASLPLKERVKNMKGAFNCNRPLHGQSIVVIDDVMTTGASLNSLAKALKKAGARRVECWVIARTLAND